MAKKPRLSKVRLPLSSPAAVHWDLIVRPEDFTDDKVQAFGKRVYEVRTASLMSRDELGKKVKMSDENIRKIENGANQHIKRNVLYKIASALGCEPHYLLGLTDNRYVELVDVPSPTATVLEKENCQEGDFTSESKKGKIFLGAIPSTGGKPVEYASLKEAYEAGARVQMIAPLRYRNEVNPDEIYQLAYRLVREDAEMQRYVATISQMEEREQRFIKDTIKFIFDHGQIDE